MLAWTSEVHPSAKKMTRFLVGGTMRNAILFLASRAIENEGSCKRAHVGELGWPNAVGDQSTSPCATCQLFSTTREADI